LMSSQLMLSFKCGSSLPRLAGGHWALEMSRLQGLKGVANLYCASCVDLS